MSRSTTDLKKLRKETRKSARRAGKKMSPVASDARESAVRYAESTRDWAAPKVEAARDWAAPRVEPVATRVKEDVLPRVAEAVTAALAASEPAREEAKSRGTAAIAALRGEVEAPKPKKHRVRKMFLLAGVVGAAVAGWKAWVGSSNSKPDLWATPIGTASSAGAGTGAGSSSTSRTTGGTGTTMSPVTDDAAGASPDEALADKAEEGAVSGAKTSPGTPSAAAGSRASTTSTTEKVPPKAAKKAAKAEGETSRPQPRKTTT